MLSFVSCDWGDKNSNNSISEEANYTQKVVWTYEAKNVYASNLCLQSGQYYYIVEYSSENGKDFIYSKIELTNGQKVWETEVFSLSPLYSPVKANVNGTDCLIILDSNELFYFIDDNTGKLLTSLTFYEKLDEYGILNTEWDDFVMGNPKKFLFVNNSLYWANRFTDAKYDNPEKKFQGIVKLDLKELDFSKQNEPQYIKPELVWTNNDTRQWIHMVPVEQDGVIYFLTYNQFQKDSYCILGAFDTGSDTIVWLNKNNKLTGNGYKNMFIADNKLFVIEEGQGCYNLKNGEAIWEQYQTAEERDTQIDICASFYSFGISYDNDLLYYTNTMGQYASSLYGVEKETVKNIQCLDAKTGQFVWGDLPNNPGSLYTNPIVLNKQCFVVGWENLRVYNSKTGELIGVDNSVKSHGMEQTISYDDMFIYFNRSSPENGTSVLTAIKAYDL